MNYWYLGVGGTHVQMFTDFWGNWVTADGQPLEVDDGGQVLDEDGNWLGLLYGDAKDFAEDTRDQLLDIPGDALNTFAKAAPVTLAVAGLIVIWYFSPWLKR